MIKDSVNKDGDKDLNFCSLTVKDGWVDQFKGIVETLIDQLTNARGVKDVYKRVKFVADKVDIKNELGTLEQYRNQFRDCLSADQL
jgi:hypothetical protein